MGVLPLPLIIKMKLSAKKARIVNKLTLFGCGISATISGLSVAFAAGTSDFWTMRMTPGVPGNFDMFLAKIGVVSGILAVIILVIRKHIDFSNMKKLDGIPVSCGKEIAEKIEHNKSFELQLKKLLDKFYNGIYGELSVGDKVNNKKSMKRGKGRVIGEYRTIYGRICIVTNADRTKTEIMFPDSYFNKTA